MRATISRLLVGIFVLSLVPPPIEAARQNGVELNSVRLYLPDDELRRRLGDDATPLADYIQALVQATREHFAKSPEPQAKGLLIAVGVKFGKRSRAWCEAVEGKIPPTDLSGLEKALEKVPAIDVKEGPLAFAIELRLGAAKVKQFPVFPMAWSGVSKSSGKPLMIPDDLFKVIWPD